MESLDSADIGDISAVGEGASEWKEVSPEAREKSKKAGQKTLVQIARSRKDERVAQGQDLLLAQVIQILLQKETQYATLNLLLDIVKEGVSPHVAIAWISLVSPEARDPLLKFYTLRDNFHTPPVRTQPCNFSESNLTPAEKEFINAWISLIFEVLVTNPSTVRTQSFIRLLASQERRSIEWFVSQILWIFFLALGITPTRALSGYSKFIVMEIERQLDSLPLEDLENGGKIQ